MASSEEEAQETPDPRARKPFLLRLQPELLEELRAWSAQDLRSLNAHIEYLLREAVKRRKSGRVS
jgi:hypothetical protein